MEASELLGAGLVGSPDALVQIRELSGDPHSGPGGRAYAFHLAGGLAFEVVPDRGLDIGAAWFRDVPVAWRSAMGAPGPAHSPSGWLGRFGGGLLVTCGLDNVGAPSGKYGQHGSHHETRAHDVVVRRVEVDGAPGVTVEGIVDSVEIFGRTVRLHRSITACAGRPEIRVRDRIVNHGTQPAPVELLFHVNFGAPLVMPGTRIEVPARTHRARSLLAGAEDHTIYPEPTDAVGESVWFHEDLRADREGYASARVISPSGLVAEVAWDTAELPRLVQWVFPTKGGWALGIEPSNAPADEDERAAGTVRVLAPGEVIETDLKVRFAQE